MSKTEPTVLYSDVRELLRGISAIIPPEKRRDFQKIIGPFLVEHEQDPQVISLLIFDLLQDRKPRPTRIDETRAQRRGHLAQTILKRRSAALAAGLGSLPDLPKDLLAKLSYEASLPDVLLRYWQNEPDPDKRAELYSAYRAAFND